MDLYMFLKCIQEGFEMASDMKEMNKFMAEAEEENVDGPREYIIEDDIMMKVGVIVFIRDQRIV